MAEPGGSLGVALRDGAGFQESSLPKLQKDLEKSEKFELAFINGSLLCSPKARAFGSAMQSFFERAMTAEENNRVSILNNNGQLLSTRRTLATVSHNELVKVGANLMDGQKQVDKETMTTKAKGTTRTKAPVPEWYPMFPVPNDARIGHSPKCLADPKLHAECKGCGRQPSRAEYRESKFRERVQKLKQSELWLLIDAVFEHFRGKAKELKALEEFMNGYFKKSTLSIPVQATMAEYFAFLTAEAENRLGVLGTPPENLGGGQSAGGGESGGLRDGPVIGHGAGARDLAANGVDATVKTERTPKRVRDGLEGNNLGGHPPAVKPRQKDGPQPQGLFEGAQNGHQIVEGLDLPSELDPVDSVLKVFEEECAATARDDVTAGVSGSSGGVPGTVDQTSVPEQHVPPPLYGPTPAAAGASGDRRRPWDSLGRFLLPGCLSPQVQQGDMLVAPGPIRGASSRMSAARRLSEHLGVPLREEWLREDAAAAREFSSPEQYTQAPPSPEYQQGSDLLLLGMMARASLSTELKLLRRHHTYSYRELEAATDSFSPARLLGEGEVGKLYHGTLAGTPVAIKVPHPEVLQGGNVFQHEVDILGRRRPWATVRFMGYCPGHFCLVYEYCHNGSLEDRLARKGGSPPLPWFIRIRIACQVADRLLLTIPGAIFQDVKPSNILLDLHLKARLADASILSVAAPNVTSSTPTAKGSGDGGPSQLSFRPVEEDAVDLFGFGVVLLQLLTNLPPLGIVGTVNKALKHKKIMASVDVEAGDWPKSVAVKVARLGLACTTKRSLDRYHLRKVLIKLQYVLGVLNEHQNEFTICGEKEKGLTDRSAPPSAAAKRRPCWSRSTRLMCPRSGSSQGRNGGLLCPLTGPEGYVGRSESV
ncbi:Protein kinase-like domain containing protein [Klebsormidium nitens]|uniref:Protein kinase-like domain containing protein n=1 Tax=Klebsormidium nitens TaxID=105231 RepID=A0A1Y1IDM6_KLENI|nr:Protein kinase-like domain containing protein [Klebsormidium nitens]|eukprot:GAQ86827.1 Protein kinase-like domain containing protein [Klebsormidium nitens]